MSVTTVTDGRCSYGSEHHYDSQQSRIQTLNTTKPDAISKRSESTANKPVNGFWKNVCMSQRIQWEEGSRNRLQWGKKEDTKMCTQNTVRNNYALNVTLCLTVTELCNKCLCI